MWAHLSAYGVHERDRRVDGAPDDAGSTTSRSGSNHDVEAIDARSDLSRRW